MKISAVIHPEVFAKPTYPGGPSLIMKSLKCTFGKVKEELSFLSHNKQWPKYLFLLRLSFQPVWLFEQYKNNKNDCKLWNLQSFWLFLYCCEQESRQHCRYSGDQNYVLFVCQLNAEKFHQQYVCWMQSTLQNLLLLVTVATAMVFVYSSPQWCKQLSVSLASSADQTPCFWILVQTVQLQFVYIYFESSYQLVGSRDALFLPCILIKKTIVHKIQL